MTSSTRKAEFAVKGVFRVTTRFGGNRHGRESAFEQRIIVVNALDDRQARKLAHRRFTQDQWSATWPAPDVAHQSSIYVGVARVLKLGGEMDPGEVWYEFTDVCPDIEQRPPRQRARSSAAKTPGKRGR